MRIRMGISWKNRAKPPCLEQKKKDEITSVDVKTAETHCRSFHVRLFVVLFFLAYCDVQSAFFHFYKHVHYLKKQQKSTIKNR